ncbi:hypothetical protein PG2001B_0489 [Bifidobacterium pseudolongum subsp. globosum]|uniref:FtsK domain-containing protein n=1 Tax=Bifidobacterium pseudolongum subsp. globosum TaxID=1690 RepID=A0A4Q5B213_9BIFI|nr:hypothetical protein PG2001B_0489 [Bifidobacterium pseudolongum subsp. globosum]
MKALEQTRSEAFWQAVKKPTEAEITAAWAQAIAAYGLTTEAPNQPVISADYLPKVSKETKDAYIETLKHEVRGAKIYGVPGAGLEDSNFGRNEQKSGERGEEVFAKLLTWDGILDHCVSYWSVYRPEPNGTRGDGADIDCILQFGNHILLVDVKNYRAGLEYHTLIKDKAMFCAYPKLRVVAHAPYIHSSNMAFAQADVQGYLASHGSGCTVESFVVLVPGSSGLPTLDPDITWPNGIPAMSYSTFVEMLKQRAMADSSYLNVDPVMTREQLWLSTLVKHIHSGPVSHIDNPLPETMWPRPTYDAFAGIDARDVTMKGHEPKTSGRHQEARRSGSQQRTQANHRAHASQGQADRIIDTLPAMGPHASFELMRDVDGNPLPFSFADVSGIFVTGAGKNGMSVCMTTLVASVLQSKAFDVTILDCQERSTLSKYAQAAKMYLQADDGFELMNSAAESLNTSMRAREMAIRSHGAESFWRDEVHAGSRPQLLIVNGTGSLYTDEADAQDEQDMRGIRRCIQRIVRRGRASGTCALLIAQQKTTDGGVPAELAELAQECQLRLCFHLPSDERVAQVLGTTAAPAFGSSVELGKALYVKATQTPQMVQFLNMMSGKLNELSL